MKKKVWKFSNFSTADPRMASSHWLRPDLDAPGCCLFSDDLILIVLRSKFQSINIFPRQYQIVIIDGTSFLLLYNIFVGKKFGLTQ